MVTASQPRFLPDRILGWLTLLGGLIALILGPWCGFTGNYMILATDGSQHVALTPSPLLAVLLALYGGTLCWLGHGINHGLRRQFVGYLVFGVLCIVPYVVHIDSPYIVTSGQGQPYMVISTLYCIVRLRNVWGPPLQYSDHA